MRVTSVELHPAGSALVCVLSFRDPTRQNPYNMKAIGGLDLSDGLVSQFYGESGSAAFYNQVMTKRDVVMRIGLNPNFSLGKSYSDLRDDLYKMVASSRTGLVQVQFLNETGVVAGISGFVTKLEAPVDVKEPEVQITLSAVDPKILTALTETDVVVAGLDPANTLIADDISTAPHGFSFVINATAAFASLVITDPGDSSWSFGVTPNGGFLNGDVVHFSSDPHNKQLYIVRGAGTIYLADVITPGSVWPIIFPGSNHISFTNPTLLTWASISYYATYWGV